MGARSSPLLGVFVFNKPKVMDLILTHGRLKERDACRLFTQTANAIAYCHAHKAVHRLHFALLFFLIA